MAGLIGLARAGHFRDGERVLFMHTGGLPGMFAYERELLGRSRWRRSQAPRTRNAERRTPNDEGPRHEKARGNGITAGCAVSRLQAVAVGLLVEREGVQRVARGHEDVLPAVEHVGHRRVA